MKNNRLLSNYEIREIYRENISNSDKSWMNDLFERLSIYPISQANKFFKKNYFYEDIKQEYLESLWVAILNYDYHKNFDFYRWAKWHLLKSNRNFINQENRHTSINLDGSYELCSSENQELKYMIKNLFDNAGPLNEREKSVVLKSYANGNTLSEISKDLGISIERVRQIRNSSMAKLRQHINVVR
tara:strand:+ start:3009 stop:3566 length:558 start_codon:yes stop_codon:yes gene_type:complete